MADPAKLLHDQLLEWKLKNNETAGHLRSLTTTEGWVKQRRAAQLLLDVEELLGRLSEDGMPDHAAERHLTRWTKMVFGYPRGWDSHGQDNLDGDSLDVLLSLSGTFRIYIPTFKDQGPDQLSAFLGAVESHLPENGSYLADHARRVIGHLQKLLVDWDSYGEFRITDAIKDLERILDELAKESPQDPFWRRARDASWAWFKNNVMLAAIASVGTAALISGAGSGMEIVQDYLGNELTAGTETPRPIDELESGDGEG